MVKNQFLTQKFILVLLIAMSLAGCRKDQKSSLTPATYHNNDYLDMPLDSQDGSSFCFNEDVEAFVLEEEQFTTPFDGAHLAYNHDEPSIQDYSLEQLDTKDEVQVVYFPYDSKEPAANQQALLKLTAKKAKELVKEGKTICCKGHSCQWVGKYGTRAYNLALSNNRAYTIAHYLEKEAGIPRDKIKIFGVGTEEPVAFEDSIEGQAPNRRVEIYALAA